MATYTYVCENKECDVYDLRFEVKHSMKDDALVQCPDCKKDTLRRVIGESGGFRIGGMGVHKPTAHWGS